MEEMDWEVGVFPPLWSVRYTWLVDMCFFSKDSIHISLLKKKNILYFALSTCYVNDALYGKAMSSDSYYMYIEGELDVGKRKLFWK